MEMNRREAEPPMGGDDNNNEDGNSADSPVVPNVPKPERTGATLGEKIDPAIRDELQNGIEGDQEVSGADLGNVPDQVEDGENPAEGNSQETELQELQQESEELLGEASLKEQYEQKELDDEQKDARFLTRAKTWVSQRGVTSENLSKGLTLAMIKTGDWSNDIGQAIQEKLHTHNEKLKKLDDKALRHAYLELSKSDPDQAKLLSEQYLLKAESALSDPATELTPAQRKEFAAKLEYAMDEAKAHGLMNEQDMEIAQGKDRGFKVAQGDPIPMSQTLKDATGVAWRYLKKANNRRRWLRGDHLSQEEYEERWQKAGRIMKGVAKYSGALYAGGKLKGKIADMVKQRAEEPESVEVDPVTEANVQATGSFKSFVENLPPEQRDEGHEMVLSLMAQVEELKKNTVS